jgi:hypothetical protein
MRLVAVAAASAVVVAVSSAAGPAPGAFDCTVKWWPQLRQSSCGNGSADNALAPSPESVATLEPAWTFEPDGLARTSPAWRFPPVVHAGPVMRAPYVYVAVGGTGKRVYALDLATGNVRWSTTHGTGGAAVADRDLLLVGNYGRLWRFVPRSGHLIWRRPAWAGSGGVPARPVIADGNW